ncbi:probable PSF1-part of GINS, replication multiprotein complex [Serendipita indica DSM 11827]|uniref:DNA replication complex GINS protein PSF1 n=1 Tax=Serendipita indica (strain DSM 11827) TaxID=1109443 RepID=G4TE71_SERID|nr:probable PSF1-part of GINS, replication multiprotein complex [Serendipita indica DSM 11827]
MDSETRLFGDQAMTLVNEARRSNAAGTLSKYNDPLVRAVCREMRTLDTDLSRITSEYEIDDSQVPDGVMAAASFYHVALRRNKRCVLAYQNHRIEKLKELYWGAAGSLVHLLGDSEVRTRLSPHEVDFLRTYNEIVQEFRGDFEDILDVVGDVAIPPKELNVVVRVVRECGTIQTELGPIDFQKGQRFMVRRADIEQLITQGFLEIVR